MSPTLSERTWTNDKLGRDIRRLGKTKNGSPRPSIDSAPGVMFGRLMHDSFVIIEDDETKEVNDAGRDLLSATFTTDHLQFDTNSHLMEKITRKAKKQQKRDTVLVTSGALTFILLAASLVTISFLMSPVIEQIFGKQHIVGFKDL